MVKVYPENIRKDDSSYELLKTVVWGLLLCVCLCIAIIVIIVSSIENDIVNDGSS